MQGIANQQILDVYVASDNSQSLMVEIKRDHADLWEQMNWYFLDHGRDVFKYEGFIEHASNRAALGESAVSDLWLLRYTFHILHTFYLFECTYLEMSSLNVLCAAVTDRSSSVI